MVLAITQRLGNKNNSEIYFTKKAYQDICQKLNILLIPVNVLTDIDYIANICDGLIITGGNDVNPKLYNETINNDNIVIDDIADKLDFSLISAFNKVNKPILGICRGIQIINVYFGGSLHQDISNHKLNINENHSINIIKDNFLYGCYQKDKITVNSTHHQAIKEVAKDFKITAISDDNIIEGIEKDNIVGVQWHPEKLNDLNFFEKFIKVYIK